MKEILFILLVTFTLTSYGQDKYSYVHFNKLTEVVGTEFVIASIEDLGKVLETKRNYLLFVNTKTGEATQVDFPNGSGIGQITQVKNDSLNLNVIIVSARTVDLDGKKGITWNDPTQIIILSPDGKSKTQLTENNFFVRTWAVNTLTGTLVITGHYDSNSNNRYDKADKNEIHIYNLKTMKLINKI